MNEQVNVIRHGHKSNEFDTRLTIRLVQASRQPFPPRVVRQKRQSLIARECQFMEMTRFVDVLHQLSM